MQKNKKTNLKLRSFFKSNFFDVLSVELNFSTLKKSWKSNFFIKNFEELKYKLFYYFIFHFRVYLIHICLRKKIYRHSVQRNKVKRLFLNFIQQNIKNSCGKNFNLMIIPFGIKRSKERINAKIFESKSIFLKILIKIFRINNLEKFILSQARINKFLLFPKAIYNEDTKNYYNEETCKKLSKFIEKISKH